MFDVKRKKLLRLKTDKTRYLSYLYSYHLPYDRNAPCSWSKQKLAKKHIKVSIDESWSKKSAKAWREWVHRVLKHLLVPRVSVQIFQSYLDKCDSCRWVEIRWLKDNIIPRYSFQDPQNVSLRLNKIAENLLRDATEGTWQRGVTPNMATIPSNTTTSSGAKQTRPQKSVNPSSRYIHMQILQTNPYTLS